MLKKCAVGTAFVIGVALFCWGAFSAFQDTDVHALLPAKGTPAQICKFWGIGRVRDALVVPAGKPCTDEMAPFYPTTAMVVEPELKIGDHVYLVAGLTGTGADGGRYAVTRGRLGHR